MNNLQPKKKKSKKWLVWFFGIILIALAAFVYSVIMFLHSVKSGELNFGLQRHDAKLTKALSNRISCRYGRLQSNQFDFSVENKEIAELMTSSGNVQLLTREYFCTHLDIQNLLSIALYQLKNHFPIRKTT